MNFDEYLVPYNWNIDWIENKINEMINLINNNQLPKQNLSCKNCAYSEQYTKVISKNFKEDSFEIQGSLF